MYKINDVDITTIIQGGKSSTQTLNGFKNFPTGDTPSYVWEQFSSSPCFIGTEGDLSKYFSAKYVEFTSNSTGYAIPSGVKMLKVICIGSGGNGTCAFSGRNDEYGYNGPGGGGGAVIIGEFDTILSNRSMDIEVSKTHSSILYNGNLLKANAGLQGQITQDLSFIRLGDNLVGSNYSVKKGDYYNGPSLRYSSGRPYMMRGPADWYSDTLYIKGGLGGTYDSVITDSSRTRIKGQVNGTPGELSGQYWQPQPYYFFGEIPNPSSIKVNAGGSILNIPNYPYLTNYGYGGTGGWYFINTNRYIDCVEPTTPTNGVVRVYFIY